MEKKHLKLIVNLLAGLAVLNLYFFPLIVSAGTADDLIEQMGNAGGRAWGQEAQETDMADIIQVVISAFLGLLGIIFLVLIIFAGYNWMTAGGDEEKVAKAKETLSRAIIGLIIIIAAYAITYFVFTNLPGGGAGGGNSAGGA